MRDKAENFSAISTLAIEFKEICRCTTSVRASSFDMSQCCLYIAWFNQPIICTSSLLFRMMSKIYLVREILYNTVQLLATIGMFYCRSWQADQCGVADWPHLYTEKHECYSKEFMLINIIDHESIYTNMKKDHHIWIRNRTPPPSTACAVALWVWLRRVTVIDVLFLIPPGKASLKNRDIR